MRICSDDRAAAIQIGAVILFGFLIISYTVYQVQVLPQQNKEVEFNHNQDLQADMIDLRGAIVSSTGGSSGESVSVSLGTTFPSRTLFVNPPPPVGTLRTRGSSNVVIAFANATDSEVQDYWNGTNRSVTTRAFVYTPSYRVFDDAPVTVYENTVLYNQFRDTNISLSDQRIVDDRTVTIVALKGNYSETGISQQSVDVEPISTSGNSVAVEGNDTDNVTLVVPTTLNNATWREVLKPEYVNNGGHILDQEYKSSTNQLIIELDESGEPYTLRMAKVGVGTGTTEEGYQYVTAVSGDGATVQEGGTIEVAVEVRDRFNNPVGSVRAYNSSKLSGSTLKAKNDNVSDPDGQVVLEYSAPSNIDGSTTKTDLINVSIANDDTGLSPFDAGNATNLTMQVTVENTDGSGLGGGGGSSPVYTIQFDIPDLESESGVTCSDAANCTYDLGVDTSNSNFLATANTTPTAAGATVDFSVNDTTIATLSNEDTETDNSGEATVQVDSQSKGNVSIFVTSGGSSDRLFLDIISSGSTVISAAEPDPEKLADSDGEFVRVFFPQSTDTTGWKIIDDEGPAQNTSLPSATLKGEYYFARTPSTFQDTWSLNSNRVYGLSTQLANGGEPLKLVDDTDTVVDEFAYGSASTSNGWSTTVNTGEVAYRTKTSGTYDDTDTASDWSTREENYFFNTLGGSDPDAGTVFVNPNNGYMKTVDTNQRVGFFDVTGPSTLGPMDTDFDGDGLVEAPYVDGNNNAFLIDHTNETQQIINYPTDPGVIAGGSRMATGDWDGDGSVSLVYADTDNNNLYRVEFGSSPNIVEYVNNPNSPNPNYKNAPGLAVADVADFNGNGDLDFVFVDDGGEITWLGGDRQGSLNGTGVFPTAQNAIAGVADYDSDNTPEVAYVDGNNDIRLADTNGDDGYFVNTANGDVSGTSLGTADIVGDGTPEVVFINQNDNSNLYYASEDGTITLLDDEWTYVLKGNSNQGTP